jgi:transcription termination factor NusB
MKPAEAKARHRAREAALQMLYQWEVGKTSAGDAILT